ncbi:HAMP domain-containing histidine kinase [Ruania suaedae]|uniref:sensor histidine kinase n=1 Tax=Ruania suaedae TaxID=2897774 RepID=UPI001E5074C7|nr:HAMP domain-containing sensor histidine kinase [Ruania suaedae]UFU03569.1 HAMP domain-containing histidine kinase [Ruania suaedae]
MRSEERRRPGLKELPLRVHLVLIMVALLVAALVATGVVTMTLLKRSLIAQVDDNLDNAVQLLENRGPFDPQDEREQPVTTYYVRVLATDGSTFMDIPATTGTDAVPDIPSVAYDQLDTLAGKTQTIGSVEGGSTWRMVLLPGFVGQDTPVTVAVALPMDDVTATLAQMQLFTLLVGLGVVTLAAAGGYVAVQRSLRGLRDIEDTAAAVASGDLSRRAPVAPDTTEVGRLAVSFNSMVATLETSFAAQAASEARMRRFVSDASHELRTPLASIRGYGELYRMGAVPQEELATTMGRIESEAVRMGSLVNDLLALARLDEGRDLRRDEVDLTAIAGDAVGDLKALDPSRPVELVTSGPVLVTGDGDRLRQVVTNLIGNVVQHTPAGTPVELHTGLAGEGAVLAVVDHGPGVAEKDADRIFERFYRPDTSRTRTSGGSGLGLAIVATIVAAHGGTVAHQPTPGGGATITVRLGRSTTPA